MHSPKLETQHQHHQSHHPNYRSSQRNYHQKSKISKIITHQTKITRTRALSCTRSLKEHNTFSSTKTLLLGPQDTLSFQGRTSSSFCLFFDLAGLHTLHFLGAFTNGFGVLFLGWVHDLGVALGLSLGCLSFFRSMFSKLWEIWFCFGLSLVC